MSVQFGIDIVLSNSPDWKYKRIAFLTNDAAKTNNGILSRLALQDAGFNLIKLFSPEHGITAAAEDGANIKDSKDPVTGLHVVSLYGNKFMPTEDDLSEIDILLFDIPDAGTRFYTYLWSMSYWIEAGAKFNKQVIILDRPNPIGGNLSMCEGPMLDPSISSFIGRFNIPIKHQCSFGELAQYFNNSQNWNANLVIVQYAGIKRIDNFYSWLTPWTNPSPALQNMEAAILYPGLCFFEATNVSIGRGTPYSFEWIGATWFNIPAMTMIWQNILREDIKIESLPLEIKSDNKTVLTKGIRIKVIEPDYYDAVLNGLLLLKLVKDLHPQDFKWANYPTNANPTGENHLSLLLGIQNAEKLFDLPLQNWLQQIGILLRVDEWRKTIEPYLLYA